MVEPNPYASPASVEQPPEAQSVTRIRARQLRAANAGAERNLRQLILCLGGGYLVMAVVSYSASFSLLGPTPPHRYYLAMAIVYTLAMTATLVIGFGARRLAAWARKPLTVHCGLGLFLFPIGTMFSLPILWILYMRPKPRLLTPEYEQIVRDSGEPPGGRTSLTTWIGFALIIVLIVSLIAISLLPPEYRRPPQ
ncbi:MAG: hypothetical protein K8T91_17010 [Planctomycetes bacterium]|nr:hypothetical protein [Planctomycetota bacterium]